jgi:hypothetical protein
MCALNGMVMSEYEILTGLMISKYGALSDVISKYEALSDMMISQY